MRMSKEKEIIEKLEALGSYIDIPKYKSEIISSILAAKIIDAIVIDVIENYPHILAQALSKVLDEYIVGFPKGDKTAEVQEEDNASHGL